MDVAPTPPPREERRSRGFVARHLDPTDVVEEFLFGAVMALTITLGAGLVVEEGPEATRRLLLGVLGCNVAWGVIDGALYVATNVLERARAGRLPELVRSTTDPERAIALVEAEFDGRLDPVTTPQERRRLFGDLARRLSREVALPVGVRREDLLGALAVVRVVFAATLPALLPFLLLSDRFAALRLANLLQLGTLFLAGWRWARATHNSPWRFATGFVVLGLALVAVAVALGG